MSTCNIGIQNAVEEILNDQPWFKYNKTSGIIEIFDSPNGKINQQNSMGVAKTIATSINKSINDGYKDIGTIAYATFLNNRGAVTIQPTKSQLELINTEDFKKFIELQEQIEDELQEEEFRKLAEESNAFLDEENNQKEEDVYFNLNSSPEVQFDFKISNIISGNLAKIKQWESNKSISQELLYNKIQQLGVPKEQLELLKNSDGNTIEEKLTNLIANYSQVIEINTAKNNNLNHFDDLQLELGNSLWMMINDEIIDVWNNDDNVYTLENAPDEIKEYFNNFKNNNTNTAYYSDLTVPGGTNYTENEIATPAITPSIKGHADFATEHGAGWFRSDDRVLLNKIRQEPILEFNEITGEIEEQGSYLDGEPELSKTRRILEVQSDWGQKQRKSSEPDINVKYDIQQIINDLQKSGDLKIDCN